MKYLPLFLFIALLLTGCAQNAPATVLEEPTVPATAAAETVPPTTEAPDPIEVLTLDGSLPGFLSFTIS